MAQRKEIPLLVGGLLDTKTNPKLVAPGSLLELENMYQLRTGELRPRNGYSLVPATSKPLNSATSLFATNGGGLGALGTGAGHASDANARTFRYGDDVSGRTGWAQNFEDGASPSGSLNAYPNVTARLTGLPAGYSSAGAPMVTVDPDLCVAGGEQHTAWDNGVDAKVYSDIRDVSDNRPLSTTANLQPATAAVRPPLVASTGGNWAALFFSSAANTLNATAHNPVTGATTTMAIAVDLAASPWFDAKAIPGTNNFAVAYNRNAGGITCGIYNPSAATFTSTVTTAGADPSFCLGWLDDSFTTGSMYLATAGSTAGVVVRTMSATTMVVSATTVIDAGATANIRNVTGHIYNTGAANRMLVLYDVAGASRILDGWKIGRYDGTSASVGSFVGGPHSLYSRTVKFSDGKYRVLGCFASPVQPMYTLFMLDGSNIGDQATAVQCHVMQGEAGDRRSQSSLTSPVLSGSTVLMAITRSRSITLPDGSKAAPNKTTSIASFSVMSTMTNARELGGTVFMPGGVPYRDDGITFEPATFSFYPEAPTGVSSALGGSMTAGGAYSYRIVFRTSGSDGRPVYSAGSVPFAITLGGADNRVTLTIWAVYPIRPFGLQNAFGQVMAEIYRRGPASTGATLYNKVGEVFTDRTMALPTISFVDGVSDANAALGQVAYFNGNTLENFNPPAHKVLEVNGNRVGIINAEDPTEFWFSKEYKSGQGIGFNPLFKVAISGDGAGDLTALAGMDGRWILFKRSAIYVLSGDGPNDLGQGSFNQPQAVSRTIGTINPASVIETPDGVTFQSQMGDFWLIDRGLQLVYIGGPVQSDTNIHPTIVTGAALVSDSSLVRFVLSGEEGIALEWDYFHKKWYRHKLRNDTSNIVGCANSALFGWCYLLETGAVMVETYGSSADSKGTTTAIIPKVSFPHLQMAGIAGYQRLHSINFTLDVLGNHTLSVDAEYDFAGGLSGTGKTIALTTATPTAQVGYNPLEGKAKSTSVRPVITVTGSPTAGTFRLTGATAIVSIKKGTIVTATDRMT